MKTPVINSTNFRAIHIDETYRYTGNQKEAIKRLKRTLLEDKKLNHKGYNLYSRLTNKGYDLLIKPGIKPKTVNVSVGKYVVTQSGVVHASDTLEIGNFTKDNANTIVDRIKEKKNKKHLTLTPIYIAIAAFLSLFGIAKCGQNTQTNNKIGTNIIKLTESDSIHKDANQILKLNKFMKNIKSY